VEVHEEGLVSQGVNLVMKQIGKRIYSFKRRNVDSSSPPFPITVFLSEKGPEANRLERSEAFAANW